MKIAIWGDSIAHGVGDAEELGWGNRIRKELLGKDEVYIRAVRGNTSIDLLERFSAEFESIKPDITIIAIGTNDSSHLKNSTDTLVKLDEFEANLNSLARKAGQTKIIFVGLFHTDQNLVQPLKGSTTGKCYSNEMIDMFNNKIEEVSGTMDAKFVSILPFMRLEDLDDGLHPNSKGHAIITERVLSELESLL